jgi:hypothetical protein
MTRAKRRPSGVISIASGDVTTRPSHRISAMPAASAAKKSSNRIANWRSIAGSKRDRRRAAAR